MRNRRTWRDTLARLRGSPTVVDLRRYDAPLDEIARFGPELERLSDAQLTTRVRALRTSVDAGASPQALRGKLDYLVRDGRIELVDDDTGRVMHDRRWPDGLQAALDAKEGLLPREQGTPLATITLQRFFGGYERLCGMTGTAQAAADELWETYGTSVVVVPTHRPVMRRDRPDVVFTHRDAKERAIVEEACVAHRAARAHGRALE